MASIKTTQSNANDPLKKYKYNFINIIPSIVTCTSPFNPI